MSARPGVRGPGPRLVAPAARRLCPVPRPARLAPPPPPPPAAAPAPPRRAVRTASTSGGACSAASASAASASAAASAAEQLPGAEWLPSLAGLAARLEAWRPPRWLWRSLAALVIGGEAMARICRGKVHWRNTAEQLRAVGPRSLGVCLLTAAFVGMVFTIQFIREFAKLGLTRSVGGVLALALSRELTPVVTSIILAGRVGSAFAAELGTMQVSEQTDSLRVLGSNPVDYLVTPRVLACMVAGPVLCLMCFAMGMAASVFLADAVYDVPANVILDSAARAVAPWDIVTSMIKCWVFGAVIAIVSCAWGFTTAGGAKGVGESTTSAVVISLVLIFVADFGLSFLFFQGQGDALKSCM
jgi:ABC transport permease subunit